MRSSLPDVHGSAACRFVDEPARAERARSEDVRAPHATATDVVPPAAEPSARSLESVRAELAHQALKAVPRKLAKARSAFVRSFDALMNDHHLRGEEAYSNVAVARACGVDEKTVRQWRSGEKHLRAEAVALFPGRLRDEVLALLRDIEGRSPEIPLVQLGRSLDAIDRQLTKGGSGNVVPALDLALVRIEVMKRKAMGE